MTRKISKRMKALAVGAAITGVLGGGAAAVLLPGVAVASQGADDTVGHVRHSQGADDAAGHVRHSQGADDPVGHVRHARGGDDPIGHT
jgi:hypothetical protein